ncbi:MAG: META domain-containing protein [Apibacter sp.]|jgi:heat shock protein HslJ|uniref:META domain-containing protein n=1 Tax=Apibacter mensalis TaxID=1586267 RepID=A0A0X3APB0_9FLAO|nr:META domain-containing protein [Apibacter mensalis]MCO6564153.1 META domain-containing protein [Apibacter sp.]CVK15718.1 META domain-containing protein [Apibacter mensalis]
MKNLIKISITSLFLLFLGTTFQSCNSTKHVVQKIDDKELQNKLGGTWYLTSIDGTLATESFKGKIPTLNFDFDKNRTNGYSGCNQYNGSFVLTGNVYNPSPMISTLMACPEYNQEPRFLELMGKRSSLVFRNYTLQFVQDGKVALEFTQLTKN